VGVDGDDEQVLAGVVDGDVLVGLEEAEFADALGGDAAGGEVGDAAGVELDACVGDIDLGGEDGEADGVDFADGRVGEVEDDVEVVDHEVEDDVDVEGAGAEDAEAVGLEEHGSVDAGFERGDGGVEAFEVADLNEAVVLVGEVDELICLGESGGDGFFDKQVQACCEQGGGYVEVGGGGNADRGGVERGGSEALLDGGKDRDTGLSGSAGVRFDDGRESHGEAGGLEFSVDADVISSKGAGAADSDTK
jgi:hypothetical protein